MFNYKEDRFKDFKTSVLFYNKAIPFKQVLEFNNDKYKNELVQLLESSFNQHLVTMNQIKDVMQTNCELEKKFIEEILESGVSESKIFKMKSSSKWPYTKRRNGYYAHWKKVIEDIKLFVPRKPKSPKRDTPIRIDINEVAVYITLDYDLPANEMIQKFFDDAIENIKFLERANREKDKEYNAFVEYAKEHDIEISEDLISNASIILQINETAKENLRDSLQDETLQVNHSDGEDCEWEVGSHRCKCGYNRFCLEIDGDVIKGFDYYGQWC